MLKKRLITASTALLFSIGMFSLPVYAHDGQSDDDNTNSAETSSSSSSGSGSTSNSSGHSTNEEDTVSSHDEAETKIENESDQETKQTKSELVEAESETEIKNLLKTHKKHSDEDRKKNCQTAEKGLENKLKNLSVNATTFQTKIDTALSLATAYQKDNNITIESFDLLFATAQTAKVKAAASVTILNGLSPNLDCSVNTVANNVASFKVAAKQAKTELMVYKDAVKAVLKSLETAKEDK